MNSRGPNGGVTLPRIIFCMCSIIIIVLLPQLLHAYYGGEAFGLS